MEKDTIIANKTVVISCAGMGKRLGADMPKALIEVCGKPVIIRQLELLNDVSDVRIVVGYQAQKVIQTVLSYRKDVKFLFNMDYETTQTGSSFSLGAKDAKDFVIALDGDLLVHPDDMKSFLSRDEELIGGSNDGDFTDNPVLMTLDASKSVTEFSRERGTLEWTGLAQLKSERIKPADKFVYQLIEPLLPVKAAQIRTKEIDTPNDLKNAENWIKNNYTNNGGGYNCIVKFLVRSFFESEGRLCA